MHRRFARLGIVVLFTVGLVALVPLFAPHAMAAGCNSNTLTINVTCVSVPGVGAVTSQPTEPTTTGCVKSDCVAAGKNGVTTFKAQPDRPTGRKPSTGKPHTVKPTPTRGAVLGIQLSNFDRTHTDFYSGSFDKALPLEAPGWHNGIYRNPMPAIAEAQPPSSWSGITAPAAFASVVLGMLLLVSAFSFKRLVLN